MSRIIAVACYKGGTGKTTTTLNLATYLRARGKAVLLVDLDPSAGASLALDKKLGKEIAAPLMAALVDSDVLLSVVESVPAWGVDVLPAGRDLTRLDEYIKGRVDGDSALRDMFDDALPVGRWDYILLDCPGAAGKATTIAMVAADEVLIPVDCKSDGAADDLIEIWGDIVALKRRLNPKLRVAGILPCRADRTKLARHIIAEISNHPAFTEHMFRAGSDVLVIRENVAVADAKFDQRPLSEYAPDSNGAKDYMAIVEALELEDE